MKESFKRLMSFSIIRGSLYSFLPMMASFYLFYFMLPKSIAVLDAEQAQFLMVFITIIALFNNNNLGFSPYITRGVAKGKIGQDTLCYLLAASVLFGASMSLILIIKYGLSLALTFLIIPAIAVSTIIRGVFEGQALFFQSFSIKLFLNSVVCIVFAHYWEDYIYLSLFLVALNGCVFIFGYFAYRQVKSLDLPLKEPFEWDVYGSFFLMFSVGLIYFYLDRFYILNYIPDFDFVKYTVEFEQIIKLALPLNLTLVFLFPLIAKEGIVIKSTKDELILCLGVWLVYLFVASFFYSWLVGSKSSNILVMSSLLSVGVFMLLQKAISLWFHRFLIIFIVVILPNAAIGMLLLHYYQNVHVYLIQKSLFFLVTVGIAFLINYQNSRGKIGAC